MKRDASLTLRRYLPALAVAVTLWCSARAPAAVAYDSFDTPTETIRLPLFQSRIITLNAPAARVSVANPDVADIVVISPTEFHDHRATSAAFREAMINSILQKFG